MPNARCNYGCDLQSEEEWTNANDNTSDEGNVAKASIANLFGHSDFDDEKREQYISQVEGQKQQEIDRKEAVLKYKADNELGWHGMITGGDGLQLSDIIDTDNWWKVGQEDFNFFEKTILFLFQSSCFLIC